MYKTILVPVDGSEPSNKGLAEAVRLARALGAAVHLVHVIDAFVLDPSDAPQLYDEAVIGALREDARRRLRSAQDYVKSQGVPCTAEMVGGRIAESIIQQVRQSGADMIVMGSHGRRGVRRMLLGSDAEIVLRNSPVPVMLVRANENGQA